MHRTTRQLPYQPRIDRPESELAGLGTGRIRTEESFAGPTVTTYDGRALAIVRPTGPGSAILTVSADGFESVSVLLSVHA